MKSSFGTTWTQLLNQKSIHHFIKKGPGSALFNNPSFQKIHRSNLRFYSTVQEWINPNLFENVQTFCLFIGHTKSGNSMLGSFIDAHPNAILADESDILLYAQKGFNRNQLFHLLVRSSRREAKKGRITARRMAPYSWQVNNQWQGRFTQLKLIGDSTSGTTTRRLAENSELYPHFLRLMDKTSIKFIHTIRNPFDPIFIMMVRGKKTFDQAFFHYEQGCRRLEKLYQQVGAENIFSIRYEDFVTYPGKHLNLLAEFLGLSKEPGYIEACTRVLDRSPQKIRTGIDWQKEWINKVNQLIQQTPFLNGYSFEELTENLD